MVHAIYIFVRDKNSHMINNSRALSNFSNTNREWVSCSWHDAIRENESGSCWLSTYWVGEIRGLRRCEFSFLEQRECFWHNESFEKSAYPLGLSLLNEKLFMRLRERERNLSAEIIFFLCESETEETGTERHKNLHWRNFPCRLSLYLSQSA